MKVTKHANECGIANAVVKYKGEFPSLTKCTVDGWLRKYRFQLRVNVPNQHIVLFAKRGRPFYLHEELDKNLHAFFTHTQMAGRTINCHVAFGVLIGLIKGDLMTYGMYLQMDRSNLSIGG